jgi:hypothetical protein
VFLSLVALLLIVVVLPLTDYRADARELTIETISNQPELTESQDSSPRIQVIAEQPNIPVAGISTEDQTLIGAVDYSRYFVVIAYFGAGSLAQDKILNVYQFKSVIWVRSQISTADNETGTISRYQAVKIDKTQMLGYGEILFRLLNGFEEKARTEQQIPKI